ncbi:hypothetical protein FOA52_011280 [Chlamydomonas sp. UWO 241]|nr:hypothetical protein FOA52_011280 [Chlamydomonas sp. UWO 241]
MRPAVRACPRAVVGRSTAGPVSRVVLHPNGTTRRHVAARGWFSSTATTSKESEESDSANWWEQGKDVWTEAASEKELLAMVANSDRLVVVDWFATWCHGCQKSLPEVSKVARDPEMQKKFMFVKACVQNMQAFARTQGVTSLPRCSVYAPGTRSPMVSIDVPASRVKHLRTNLAVISGNPGMAYVLDPNGFVIPRPKDEAAEAEAAAAKAKAKAIAEMEESKAGLYEHLMSVGNGKGAKGQPAAATVTEPTRAASPSRTGWPHSLGLGAAYEQDKQTFLRQYGAQYGYDNRIDELYPAEVGVRMGPNEHYLDYTGSSVYMKSQLAAVFDDLQSHVFGNPHSANPSSELSSQRIDDVRLQLLNIFNADPKLYTLVFTRSATGALKIVGETFPWTGGSTFRYLRENHNSVLGIREYARSNGATFQAVDEAHVESWVSSSSVSSADASMPPPSSTGSGEPIYSLFAYPAEDNFAGVKYPTRWVESVRAKSTPSHRWLTLVDAAAYAANTPLDLKQFPADFVDVAFYKIFGYPSGLGALLVRTDVVPLLRKVFWGGGTVALATATDDFHVLKCKPSDKLEDGTVSFLDILSLRHGIDSLNKLGGMTRINAHTGALARWAYQRLSSIKHSNGTPVLEIYGKHTSPDVYAVQGPIINFNPLLTNGRSLSYKTFELEAAVAGFHVRTGTECNPGAAYTYLGVSEAEVESLAGIKEGCEDDVQFVHVQRPAAAAAAAGSGAATAPAGTEPVASAAVSLNHPAEIALEWVDVPLGSVRISLGWMSTFEDVYAFARFVEDKYKDREQ